MVLAKVQAYGVLRLAVSALKRVKLSRYLAIVINRYQHTGAYYSLDTTQSQIE